MFRSFTKTLLVLLLLPILPGFGQEAVRDTTKKSDIYGLRLGIDLSRPLITLLNEDYRGLELVGDYRISEHLYLAAELGNESKTIEETLDNADDINVITLYDIESSGSYLKLGIDYNTYSNWYGMNNSIIIGARYAFSTFSNTLNNYRYFNSNRYWNPDSFTPGNALTGEYDGLNASWLELLAGVKAELFANFFMGASIRLHVLITDKDSGVFTNIWIPGFNRKTDNSRFGWGFNYTLSYMLPIYRKAREKPTELRE